MEQGLPVMGGAGLEPATPSLSRRPGNDRANDGQRLLRVAAATVARFGSDSRTSTGPHIEPRSHIEDRLAKPHPRRGGGVNGRTWD